MSSVPNTSAQTLSLIPKNPRHRILGPFRRTSLVDRKRAYAERPSDIGVRTIKYDADLLLIGYLVLLDGYHPV